MRARGAETHLALIVDFDWSPIELDDEQTGDFQSVAWVIEQLNRQRRRPFFLACGIYRPHLPWYVPQKYFDLFPVDEVVLPKVLENDLDELSSFIPANPAPLAETSYPISPHHDPPWKSKEDYLRR
jgi:hypothetical protein